MEDKIDKKKILKLEKSFRSYRIGFYCIFTLFLIFFVIFYFFIHLDNNIYYENPKVIFKESLSSNQISFINDMLKDLKPLYFNSVKSLVFFGNRSEIVDKLNPNRAGYSDSFGNIYLYISDDLEFNRQALCHEISHKFLKGDNEKGYNEEILSEDYAYDLMKTKFCFKEDSYNRCSQKIETSYYNYDECAYFYKDVYSQDNYDSNGREIYTVTFS